MDDLLDFDDSYILQKHKESLQEAIKIRITENPDFKIYDDTMLQVLCMDMYKKTINGMDKEQYLRELKETDKKNMFNFTKRVHLNGIVVENVEDQDLDIEA